MLCPYFPDTRDTVSTGHWPPTTDH